MKIAVAAFVAWIALCGTARAQEEPGPARAQEDERRWYGWELVLADAAAVALVTAPLPADAGPVTRGVGFTLLFMNGSIVHMANGNARSASVSLLRLPALLIGHALGTAIGELACDEVRCLQLAPLVGAAVGISPVVLFDWVSATKPADGRPVARRPSVMPPASLAGRGGQTAWRLTMPLAAVAF